MRKAECYLLIETNIDDGPGYFVYPEKVLYVIYDTTLAYETLNKFTESRYTNYRDPSYPKYKLELVTVLQK